MMTKNRPGVSYPSVRFWTTGASLDGLDMPRLFRDPLTNGHLSLVLRGLTVFVRIVAVPKNQSKSTPFTLDERLDLLRSLTRFSLDEDDTTSFESLTVDFARSKGGMAIMRGLRGSEDFGHGYQLAGINRHPDTPQSRPFKWPTTSGFISFSRIMEAVSPGASIVVLLTGTVP
jgi:pantetheine-phosphate adenylyltransferase